MVLGLSPWSTPLRLYAEMLGVVPTDEAESEAAYWGKALEARVLARYASDEGLHVVTRTEQGGDTTYQVIAPTGSHWHIKAGGNHAFNEAIGLLSLVHPEHEWHTGTPDAMGCRQDGSAFRVVEGIEAKTSSAWRSREWGAAGTDDIPDEYIPQPMQYMGICRALGYELPWAVAALIGGQRYKLYRVPYDQAYYDHLLAAELDFMARLRDRRPPEAIAGDVPTLAAIFPEAITDKVIEAPAGSDLEGMARAVAEAAARIKAAEADKDAATAKLLQRMGKAERMLGEGWSITYRTPNPSSKVDWQEVVGDIKAELQFKSEAQDVRWARELLDAIKGYIDERTTETTYRRRHYPSRLASLLDG